MIAETRTRVCDVDGVRDALYIKCLGEEKEKHESYCIGMEGIIK